MEITEIVNLVVGGWGALTGTLALAIQYFGHRNDKACLRVEANMFFGDCRIYGAKRGHFLNVKLTNYGRRIVRIQAVALRIKSPWRVAINSYLLRKQLTQKVVQPDISIYNGSVNPIPESPSRLQNVEIYPPKKIYVDESQKIELTLGVDDKILEMLPETVAWAIVIDHLGRKYKARYLPMKPFRAKQEEATTSVKMVEAT